MSLVNPHKLHPNPGNTIFDPLPPEVYEALKADIAQRGLLNPILCTSDYTIIAGHHRLQAALELGLAHVAVDIQDVGPDEAEDRLIADNVLRRQLNPMEQARLIKRLKERAGIKRGNPHGVNSVKFTELTQAAGVPPETAKQLHRLNTLIPALQDLVSAGTLSPSHGVALAGLPPTDQQALYDALGSTRVAQIKPGDIQQAKREATPSHTAPEIQAILRRIADLQAKNAQLETQLADAEDPNDSGSDLLDQLASAQAERDQLAAQIAAWQAQPQSVVERIVEKAVPTPDPALTERLDELQKRMVGEQRKVEAAEKKRLETQDHYKHRLTEADKHAADLSGKLAEAQAALQAIGQSRKAEDVALTHGGTLLWQLRSATAPLLTAWPKLAPLSIHCRLPDVESTAEVQAIAEQLGSMVEALQRVIRENSATPATVIDITSHQSALAGHQKERSTPDDERS